MGFIDQFVIANTAVFTFIYGLALFLMGIGILLQHKASSQTRLAKSLPFLAFYGLTHGLSEWGEVFMPLQERVMSGNAMTTLKVLHMGLVVLSFVCLLAFGAKLMAQTKGRYWWAATLPGVALLFWFSAGAGHFLTISDPVALDRWLFSAETWVRYLGACPGALISSYALLLQRKEFDEFGLSSMSPFLSITALTFAAYAVIGGLIVPPGDFFPAKFFNTDRFLTTVGLHIQLARVIYGIVISYLIIRVLGSFNLENQQRLERLKRQEAILLERERIGRDLHDGIIQSIYGAVLTLDNSCHLVDKDPKEAKAQIRYTMAGLHDVMRNIRNYILGLQPPDFEEKDFRKGLERFIQEFRANSLIGATLSYQEGAELGLPAGVFTHLYHVVKELLINVAKHARAGSARVSVTCQNGLFCLSVEDDGVGLNLQEVWQKQDQHEKRGLHNVATRVELVGGTMDISSSRDNGTRVEVRIPVGGERVETG